MRLPEPCFGGGCKFGTLVESGGGTAGHVGLAATFAAGDGCKFLDEFACHQALGLGALAAECAEVQLLAVVDDAERRLGELPGFESVEELLQQRGRAVGSEDEVVFQ